jgi:hypothetical protein
MVGQGAVSTKSGIFRTLFLAVGVACASTGAGIVAGTGHAIAQIIPQDAQEPSFTPLPPPSLNFYGSVGLIDMPSAGMLPDGQYTTTISHFAGQTRFNLTFQAFPWLSATFRYNGINDLNLFGFSTYYDRGFDLRLRLLKEGRLRPGVTLGLQDFAGTGVYAGEYIVATKKFRLPAIGSSHRTGRGAGQLKISAGLGWGRLGSFGSIGRNGRRPAFVGGSLGGNPSVDQWFRGRYAPFGGIEWQVNDRLGLKMEYSSDAYRLETRRSSVFKRESPLNFGIEWQAKPRTRIGAYYLYGSEFGLSVQFQLSPKQPATRLHIDAPPPVVQRPPRAGNLALWDDRWATTPAAARTATLHLRGAVAAALEQHGLRLETLSVNAGAVELRFANLRYASMANAVGRAARVLAATMPSSVETFLMVPVQSGMALSAVTIRRSDLEALEFAPDNADALLAVTGISDAPALSDAAAQGEDIYPSTDVSFAPYFLPSYFDPSRPVRIDVGVTLQGTYRPAPGWTVSGTIRHRLAGNIKTGRASNSRLPHVRTDAALYAQEDTTLNNLFVSKQWRAGSNLYARATFGYLEAMFGGLSSELLWKPVGSRLALGVEANYVRQRAFDQRLGFRNYSVFTGHASAYYDFGRGYLGQVDVGRYLAGDVGATFAMDRTFDNGWSVGAFFTLTSASAAEFGEGSFDKGIRFSIPVGWFLGRASRQRLGTTIRPIQRDGGVRLYVPGRLYGQVRQAHKAALSAQWARVWE